MPRNKTCDCGHDAGEHLTVRDWEHKKVIGVHCVVCDDFCPLAKLAAFFETGADPTAR